MGVENCIAIQFLYCRQEEARLENFVLQYNILYCDSRGSRLLDCVATQGRDTASQATTRHRRARRARAARRRWARRGRWAGGRRWAPGGAQHGMARSAVRALRHSWGARPRHDKTRPRHGSTRAAMRGLGSACAYLGVLLGCGLCTWCTQPVFDPV